MYKLRAVVLTIAALISCLGARPSAAEMPQDELAAQIRVQGYVCDKALGATRDKARSRPDYAVWLLRCSNATYRVSRAPDMAAKIEPLP